MSTTPANSIAPVPPAPPVTSLTGRLFGLLACPADVFDEVAAGPHRPAHWLVPMLLLCLAGLIVAGPASEPRLQAGLAHLESLLRVTSDLAVGPDHAARLAHRWRLVAAGMTCLSVLFGTLWSAGVLWGIGRFLLKSDFPYVKALEVAGLTGIILLLGTVVTHLLIAASGDPAARPALSWLARQLPATSPVRAALDLVNVFHLWSTTVLAIGLARLGGVSFKEAAFWVYGYWLAARLAVLILS